MDSEDYYGTGAGFLGLSALFTFCVWDAGQVFPLVVQLVLTVVVFAPMALFGLLMILLGLTD